MTAKTTLKPFDTVAVKHPDGGIVDTGQILTALSTGEHSNGWWLVSSDNAPYAEYEVHESRLVKS